MTKERKRGKKVGRVISRKEKGCKNEGEEARSKGRGEWETEKTD